MRICVEPVPSSLSRAMHRVARNLSRYVPDGLELVSAPGDADLQFLHVIGNRVLRFLEAPDYACIQYCYLANSTPDGTNERMNAHRQAWLDIWKDARLVWSYYDLSDIIQDSTPFLLSPLGIDEPFTEVELDEYDRPIGVMSSGYVAGPGAEAIEEVAIAARTVGMNVVHLGPPKPARMRELNGGSWRAVSGINDKELATYYANTRWVSGLRHVEGFELPILEGLACGARPIVFDRPEMRHWYDGHAVFVKESSGQELVEQLLEVFSSPPEPVTKEEQQKVLERFDWERIASTFWSSLEATL